MAFRGLAFFEGFEVKGLEAALLTSIISNEAPSESFVLNQKPWCV